MLWIVNQLEAAFGDLGLWIIPLLLLVLGTLAVGLLWGLYRLLLLIFPKVTAIALVSGKQAMSQPLLYVVLGIGSFLLLIIFPFMPYNTFGEDLKMVKQNGLVVISLLSIVIGLLTASDSIHDEIEGRTALTLLSKPIGRLQFILGKFLGVLLPVALVFIILSTVFLGSVSYKTGYDARESAGEVPSLEARAVQMDTIVPGLVLAFFETVVLTSISVAISTRLPMLANLIICISIYWLGHLLPLLVNSSMGKMTIVRFMGQLMATVLPVLENFNIHAAVAAGRPVPLEYLGTALLYCVLYCTFALLLALLLFEDRDLA